MLRFLGFDLEVTVEAVLIRADGPLLCTGRDFLGQRWLIYRSHRDRVRHTWLCSPVTDQALARVVTGQAAPRDALRHSSTGVVEVVRYTDGEVMPDSCLRCDDIPESLLPSSELTVRSCVHEPVAANPHRRPRRHGTTTKVRVGPETAAPTGPGESELSRDELRLLCAVS
jgi:hypothetical protein